MRKSKEGCAKLLLFGSPARAETLDCTLSRIKSMPATEREAASQHTYGHHTQDLGLGWVEKQAVFYVLLSPDHTQHNTCAHVRCRLHQLWQQMGAARG
jgi:hypothetical protein